MILEGILGGFLGSAWAQEGFSGYILGDYSELEESADASWSETFESGGVSWRPLYQEMDVKITDHQRTNQRRHLGEASEEMTLNFSNPGFAFLGHYVDYPLFIGDVSPSLWVWADKPGVTLGLLIVLPQTIRPDTKTPLNFLLLGSTYIRAGEWEELSFGEELQQKFNETIQAIRGEHKIKVNPKDAYIRQVVLFAENGMGDLHLAIDDLKIHEHVPQSLEILKVSEKEPFFSPINLLAFRFQATRSSIALESTLNKMRKWPTEPFAMNSDFMKTFARSQAAANFSGRRSQSIYTRHSQNVSSLQTKYSEEEQVGSANFRGQGEFGDNAFNISTADYRGADSVFGEGGSSAIILGSGTRPVSLDQSESFPQNSAGPFPEVRFSERILYVGDPSPYAIRAIEYQGEPFSFLKKLRFNAVWLKVPPTRQILEEAKKTGMWLIAPPPIGEETVSVGASGGELSSDRPYFNGGAVTADYDSVLLWDLGSGWTEGEVQTVAARAAAVKGLDPHRRPIMANAKTGLRQFTDQGIDLLLLKRAPMLTSLNFSDYGVWLQQYPNLMTVGTPFWNQIQTQPDDQLLAQCRFFGAVDDMPSLISYEQIREEVRFSLAAGIHGLLFASNTPLNGPDHEAQYRACALELINLELLMIDPWFAGGTPEEVIDLNKSSISATTLRTKSTTLLLPVSMEAESQMVFGPAAASNQSFVVPARDGYSADLLLPGKMRKIPSHRRAGGISLSLEEVDMNSLVFLAQSNWYTRVVAEKTPKLGRQMAELAIRLAKMRFDTFKETFAKLKQMEEDGAIPTIKRQPLLPLPDSDSVIEQSCAALNAAEDYLNQGDFSEAYLQAERALREVRMNERRLWKLGTRLDQCHPVLPVSVSFTTLPAYIDTYGQIASGQIRVTGENRLLGGNMERIEDWTAGHWNRTDLSYPGLETSLRCETAAARQGTIGLSFSVQPVNGAGPMQMEGEPLKVEVPVSVRTGELLCFEGWIKIPNRLQSGVDGFMIYESQGGISLAQRYYQTEGWQRFAFYRYAAYDGEMKLTFSLASYGTVYLDDVVVRAVR